MCNFDFFYVLATASTVSALKAVGVERTKIKKVTDWNVPTPWPKVSYESTLEYVNVMGIGHERARKLVDEFVATLPKVAGVNYYVRFVAVD